MAGKKDRNREAFSGLTAKTVWFTIEPTNYGVRPYRMVLWSERNLKEQPIHIMLVTVDDLQQLSKQISEILDRD